MTRPSINGALFYENKFLLNNVNIGNSLNPASGSTDNTVDGLAGSSLNANISVAVGIAIRNPSYTLLDAVQEADEKMFENKRLIKN